MDRLLEIAKEIARQDFERPAAAYRRLQEAVESAAYPLPLPDRDLVAAAREACRRGENATALVALEELELRMVGDEPIESLVRRVA
jgi:hypothetical protein